MNIQMNNGAAGYIPAVVGISHNLALAITEHYSAWVNFQIADGIEASMQAGDGESDALFRLLATPADGIADVLALVAHLEWYAAEEAQCFNGDRELNDLPFVVLANLKVALR